MKRYVITRPFSDEGVRAVTRLERKSAEELEEPPTVAEYQERVAEDLFDVVLYDAVDQPDSEEELRELIAKANAWDQVSAALGANARGESHSSAADVCAVGFSLQEQVGNARHTGRAGGRR